jgi:hypothetical protein
LSNGKNLSGTTTVPDLSIAGTTLFGFAASGVSILTTGITDADRMSFGYPPGAFTPGGYADFVLELNYSAPIPEPTTWTVMLTGLLCLGGVMHSSRRGSRRRIVFRGNRPSAPRVRGIMSLCEAAVRRDGLIANQSCT